MAIPPRRWVGYGLLTAGLSFLFDTYTFLQTDYSPLRVPLSAYVELIFGYGLAICGGAFILWPRLVRFVEDVAPDASMKLGQSVASHSIEWRRQRRLPLSKRFVVLPNRGLVGGSAVLLLLLPMYLMLAPPDSKGIYVRTTPSLHLPDEYCLAGPIVLSLRKNGASTRTYLNGAEIKPEQLARALRAQLAARANWEVFVEGDDSLDFAESMNTIALITDLHTKTVLLTPQLKRELASQCSSR